MSRYIDADAYFDEILNAKSAMECIAILHSMLAVDVVEVVRCKDCIFYDQPHVIKDGERYEYSEMPKDAIECGMVSCEYGYNVGGRCCVDDYKGYSEDKRVFVSEDNYCGRAVARKKVTE